MMLLSGGGFSLVLTLDLKSKLKNISNFISVLHCGVLAKNIDNCKRLRAQGDLRQVRRLRTNIKERILTETVSGNLIRH